MLHILVNYMTLYKIVSGIFGTSFHGLHLL